MNVYEIVTERIIKTLESGTIPWKQPWKNDGTLPTNLVTKKPYRGMNLFLLPQTYPTKYFVSYKQALNLGGCVKQGEKGYLVVFWKIFRSGNPVDSDTTEETTTSKTVPMLRYYTVFNIAQTTIPESKIPPAPAMNTIDPIVQCETIVSNMPKRPEIKTGESEAYYRPSQDIINMPVKGLFTDSQHYYSTLFHEMGHSTGHETRLNRSGIATDRHGFGSKSYSREELVAEMTAAFLCGQCGIETTTLTDSAGYIQSWIKSLREDKRCVVTAASQAQKAADFILGKSA